MAPTASGDDYVWIGSTAGSWDDAANWEDVTAGNDPAFIPPGPDDAATITAGSGQTITLGGTGSAATVTLQGAIVLNAGTIAAGSASVDSLTLQDGSNLAVAGALTGGAVTDGVRGDVHANSITALSAQLTSFDATQSSSAMITGLLDVGAGEVTSSDFASVHVGSLTASSVAADAYSILEVGGTTDTSRGWVWIDPGATLTLLANAASGNAIYGNLHDDGVVSVEAGLDLLLDGTVAGTGTIALGGNVQLELTYQTTTFSSDVTVSLHGTDNTLVLPVAAGVAIQTEGFAAGDAIELYPSGHVYPTNLSYTLNGDDLAVTADGATNHFYLLDAQPGLTFSVTYDDVDAYLTAEAPCFCPGTLIQTDRGPVVVEHLAVGDRIITIDGTPEPVRWIGQRSYAGAFIAGNAAVLPVCIKADALAAGMPSRDLWVSPGHALFVDGQLVPAARLVNGVSIVQAEAVDSVTYYHVELPRHAVLFANGAPAESFLDDDCRNQFQNAASFYAAYKAATPMAPFAPRLEDGFALQSIQERLALRAGVFPSAEPIGALRGFVDQAEAGRVTGWAQDCDSPEEPVALEIVAGTTPVLCALANAYRADLRQGGMGSGCHAFDVTFDFALDGPVTIRRVADGAVLPFTASAVAALAA